MTTVREATNVASSEHPDRTKTANRKYAWLIVGFAVLLVGMLGLIVIGGSAAASAETGGNGTPNVTVHLPESELEAGTDDILTLQIENDAHPANRTDLEDLLIARSVSVTVNDSGPLEVGTRTQSVGTLDAGAIQTADIGVTVPENVDPGEYDLELEFRYANLTADDRNVTRHQTVRRTATVEVVERPRFAIAVANTTAQIGTSGTLSVEVENVGERTARDVALALEAESPRIGFSGEPEPRPADTGSIAELAPDESATLEFDVDVGPDVAEQPYGLDATVRYTDEDGIARIDERPATSFEPLGEQSFDLVAIESTLRPGETGTIRATIVNDGPLSVEDATAVFESGPFEPRSASFAIGDLDPGEEATVTFRGTVPREADAVPQRVELRADYTTVEGIDGVTRESTQVPIEERREAIDVSSVSDAFVAGNTSELELELTNQRDVELREISVTLAVEDPLESDFRTTSIDSLEPDESGTVAFDIEVDSDARETSYPAVVEIEYVDENDEIRATRPHTVSLSVIHDPAGLFFAIEVLVFAVVVILVAAAFVWLYRR